MIASIKSRINKFFAALALLSIEVVVALAVFLIALFLFIQVARMVFLNHKEAFDSRAFVFLSHYVTDINTQIMQFFTFLGTHTFLIPANIILISYFLFIKKHKWYSIKIPVISISTVLLMYLLKFIFNRPRPLMPLLREARGLSFPSGHALNSLAFYGLLIYLVWQNIRNVTIRWIFTFILATIILMIGLSRIYLRVHYASDVMAGFAVGIMWLIIAIWIIKKIENYGKKKIMPVIEKTTSLGSQDIKNPVLPGP
jgi:undecaprenyl-diphosphatase